MNTQLRPDLVTTVDQRDAALVRELIDAGAQYTEALVEARRRFQEITADAKARFDAAQAALLESRELEAA